MRLAGWILAAVLLVAPIMARAADTLVSVRHAGVLACGVNIEQDDYSKSQEHGDLSLLDQDVCKAVAAAVGVKLSVRVFDDDPTALAGLRDGAVALLVGETADPTYAAAFGVAFGPPVFFDGQGFLVHRDSGIASMQGLADKPVCFISETQAQRDLNDALAARGIAVRPFPFEEMGEMEAALVDGHCAAIAAPVSQLADMRRRFHARVRQYAILPQTISLQPLQPVYRVGDPAWARIVDWAVHALVLAEQDGVSRKTAQAQRETGLPEVRYLLGGAPGVGRPFGLDDDWALRAVQAVGNYGEMYARDVGGPWGLPRGRNALWSQGGMLYAPPLR